jgi:hypothetical protein
MKRPRVTVVEKARELFTLCALPPHRGFEQRFLNIARHVPPHIHYGPSQEIREAFV